MKLSFLMKAFSNELWMYLKKEDFNGLATEKPFTIKDLEHPKTPRFFSHDYRAS